MKTLVILFNLLLPLNEGDTLYQQKLQHLHHNIFKPYAKGTFLIKNDSVFFVAKKQKKSFMNFSISVDEIKKVKNEWLYIFPNRLTIVTDEKKYLLFTYKRRRIRQAILKYTSFDR